MIVTKTDGKMFVFKLKTVHANAWKAGFVSFKFTPGIIQLI